MGNTTGQEGVTSGRTAPKLETDGDSNVTIHPADESQVQTLCGMKATEAADLLLRLALNAFGKNGKKLMPAMAIVLEPRDGDETMPEPHLPRARGRAEEVPGEGSADPAGRAADGELGWSYAMLYAAIILFAPMSFLQRYFNFWRTIREQLVEQTECGLHGERDYPNSRIGRQGMRKSKRKHPEVDSQVRKASAAAIAANAIVAQAYLDLMS